MENTQAQAEAPQTPPAYSRLFAANLPAFHILIANARRITLGVTAWGTNGFMCVPGRSGRNTTAVKCISCRLPWRISGITTSQRPYPRARRTVPKYRYLVSGEAERQRGRLDVEEAAGFVRQAFDKWQEQDNTLQSRVCLLKKKKKGK